MISYILRRIAYAIPILIGVNVITFILFFVVNTPDDMARMQLGAKHVSEAAIEKCVVKLAKANNVFKLYAYGLRMV